MDSKLLNACLGKSKSTGGLNFPEMKKALIKLFPKHRQDIQKRTRKSLYQYCKRHFGEEIREAKERYFVKGAPLNKRQMDYCRCLAHISAKNPEWCYKHGAWKTTRKGSPCYNPYAICTKSTRRKGRFHCTKYYNLENMPSKEVKALARMKGLSVTKYKILADQERQTSFVKIYY